MEKIEDFVFSLAWIVFVLFLIALLGGAIALIGYGVFALFM